MLRLVLTFVVTLVCAACASSGAVPRPFPMPGSPSDPPPLSVPRPRTGALATADGYSISSTALSLRGAPYRHGGVDPAGFDCSGFVKYVFERHGVTMPRDTRKQFSVGHEVAPTLLEPGDLVFFTTVAPGASHVGIAIGGDQFVHAPSTTGVVRVETLSAQYWSSRFIGAKRIN
ncbi:MAG: C40 family peptidase [Acidobacteria bacterium]|nr:C40 family peptidase [Acidobacteriota bacterium]